MGLTPLKQPWADLKKSSATLSQLSAVAHRCADDGFNLFLVVPRRVELLFRE